MATPSSILAWGNPMDKGAWWATVHGVTKELDMTLQLNNNNSSSLPSGPNYLPTAPLPLPLPFTFLRQLSKVHAPKGNVVHQKMQRLH